MGCKGAKFLLLFCMLEGICGIAFNILCILMWACVFGLDELLNKKKNYFYQLYIYRFLDTEKCDSKYDGLSSIHETQGQIFERSSTDVFIFSIIYLALNTIWTISAIIAFTGLKSRGRVLLFILSTLAISLLDVAGVITYGVDMKKSIDQAISIDGRNSSLFDMFLVIVFGRGLIFLILNIVAMICVLKSSGKSSPKSSSPRKERNSSHVSDMRERTPKTSPVPPPLRQQESHDDASSSRSSSVSSSDSAQEKLEERIEEVEQEKPKQPPPITLPKPQLNAQQQHQQHQQQQHQNQAYGGTRGQHNQGFVSEETSSSSSEDEKPNAPPPTILRNQKPWSYLDTQARKRIATQQSSQNGNDSESDSTGDFSPQIRSDEPVLRAHPSEVLQRPADPPIDYEGGYQTGSRPASGFRYEARSRF